MTQFIKTLGLSLFLVAAGAQAHGGSVGDIAIAHPYSLPTPPGATTGAGYLRSLTNRGSTDDRLVGASSPVAVRVELHTMSMDGDVMRMRAVTGIAIPAGGRVDMAPGGGDHLMLVGIRRPFKVGDRIPLTLNFEKAGPVDVELVVQERRGASAAVHQP